MSNKPAIEQIKRPKMLCEGQRNRLPADEYIHIETVSVWELLKPMLRWGAELFRMAMPVQVNEPLSFLQRLSENTLYSDLLIKANQSEDDVERIKLVSAFVVATISSNYKRLAKPFNPLLLETYELERNGVRYLAEQVSHHPPISAVYAESDDFVVEAVVSPTLGVNWTGMVAIPNAKLKLTLKRTGETYTWDAPKCSICNVVVGKMYMNFASDVTIKSSGKCLAELSFTGKGYSNPHGGSDLHVEGVIRKGDKPVTALYGNWALYLASCDYDLFKKNRKDYVKTFNESLKAEDQAVIIPGSKTIWVANVLPPLFDEQFHLPYYVLSLNEIYEGMGDNLPPTDSRRRPDIRAFDEGYCDIAENVKRQLENEQRERARNSVAQVPVWFEKDENGDWKYKGKYWNRKYADSPDLFVNGNEVYLELVNLARKAEERLTL